MSISILPGDRSASVQLQSPACRDGEFPQSFGRALEDAELWGEPLTLLWTHPQPGAAFWLCLCRICRWAAEMGLRLNTGLEPARGGGVSFSLQFRDCKIPPIQHFPSFSVESLSSAAGTRSAGEAGEHTCHCQHFSGHPLPWQMKHHVTSAVHDQNPWIFRLVMTGDKSVALKGGAEGKRKVIPFLPPLPLSRS